MNSLTAKQKEVLGVVETHKLKQLLLLSEGAFAWMLLMVEQLGNDVVDIYDQLIMEAERRHPMLLEYLD